MSNNIYRNPSGLYTFKPHTSTHSSPVSMFGLHTALQRLLLSMSLPQRWRRLLQNLPRWRRPFLNSAYPVTAMEAIHELTVCPVTAKEAVQELSACPVMAKETIHELSACPVTAMETVHELTFCTVAAMETAQELPACSVVCPCLYSTMDPCSACSAMAPCSTGSDLVVSWSTALRSAIAPWPRSSTVPQSATDPWPRTSSAPWSRPTSAPWFRPALAPGSRSTTGVHAMTHGLAQCPTLHAMIQVLFLFTGLVLRPSPCFTSAPPPSWTFFFSFRLWLVVLVMCLVSHWLVCVMWPSLFDINSPHVAFVLWRVLICVAVGEFVFLFMPSQVCSSQACSSLFKSSLCLYFGFLLWISLNCNWVHHNLPPVD